MKLVLCRHGNTFAPGDRVVRVGAQEDLPLVERGYEQADELARYLKAVKKVPQAVYCGPLKRTVQTAERIIEVLQLDCEVRIDFRLNEIDYGSWGGLTNEEIVEKFGQAELLAWDDKSVWPSSGVFQVERKVFVNETLEFARSLAEQHRSDEVVLVVSSNGRIRYFAKLITGEFEKRQAGGELKVKTGHVCELEFALGKFTLQSWNASPV